MPSRTPSLTLTVRARTIRWFHFFGATGIVVGAALGMTVAAVTGRSVGFVGALALVATLTFVALAVAARVLIGRDAIVYYQHQVAILAVAAIVAAAAGRPVLATLDLVVLGVGTTLAFGRLGCHHAGCCHGRPAARGVRYAAAHVADGFPAGLADVPLVRIQLVEAALVGALVIAATVFAVVGAAGSAITTYVVGYAVVRLLLEPHRGDGGRPYLRGRSEAQWWALAHLTAVAVIMVVATGRLLVAVGLLMAAGALDWLASRAASRRPSARELGRFAQALSAADDAPGTVVLVGTLAVSRQPQDRHDGGAAYTVSQPRGLSRAAAAGLLDLLAALRPALAVGSYRVVGSAALQIRAGASGESESVA